jgi:hypothetical protein
MTQALGTRLGLTESKASIILEESASDLMKSKDPEIRAAVSLSSRSVCRVLYLCCESAFL